MFTKSSLAGCAWLFRWTAPLMWSAVSVGIQSSESDPTPAPWSRSQLRKHTFGGQFSMSHVLLNLPPVPLYLTHRHPEELQMDLKGVSVSVASGGGPVLTTGGGALLHLGLWVRGSRDNASVNTPDGDLWALWKFNVTLRATCTCWGQRWAQPGDGPRLPCVSALETKCQWGGIRS